MVTARRRQPGTARTQRHGQDHLARHADGCDPPVARLHPLRRTQPGHRAQSPAGTCGPGLGAAGARHLRLAHHRGKPQSGGAPGAVGPEEGLCDLSAPGRAQRQHGQPVVGWRASRCWPSAAR